HLPSFLSLFAAISKRSIRLVPKIQRTMQERFSGKTAKDIFPICSVKKTIAFSKTPLISPVNAPIAPPVTAETAPKIITQGTMGKTRRFATGDKRDVYPLNSIMIGIKATATALEEQRMDTKY